MRSQHLERSNVRRSVDRITQGCQDFVPRCLRAVVGGRRRRRRPPGPRTAGARAVSGRSDAARQSDAARSQPVLHNLVTCLRAPTTVLSAADGQLRGVGAQGVLVADVRVIATALLTVGAPEVPAELAEEPEFVAMATHGADLVEFISVIRTPWHRVPDPAVWIRRHRRAVPLGCAESITVSSVLDEPIELAVRLRLATDLAGIWAVRAGRSVPGSRWRLTDGGAEIPHSSVSVAVSGPDGRVPSECVPPGRDPGRSVLDAVRRRPARCRWSTMTPASRSAGRSGLPPVGSS